MGFRCLFVRDLVEFEAVKLLALVLGSVGKELIQVAIALAFLPRRLRRL